MCNKRMAVIAINILASYVKWDKPKTLQEKTKKIRPLNRSTVYLLGFRTSELFQYGREIQISVQ